MSITPSKCFWDDCTDALDIFSAEASAILRENPVKCREDNRVRRFLMCKTYSNFAYYLCLISALESVDT
ncbi:MAG: hypothetical protein SAK29_32940 [Scytonema sp. PMC 1069.18]|nr:hypothetical protein [Scytonema sp. PMC 1069.18]MEC4879931.1 hypothetical protein [Scytonema sp. PMC 1070.18]